MAEEKKIVLSIETITDQAVMEAYGKVLNDVLGSYEDNIALIAQYNAQMKENQARIKEIEKATEAYGRTTKKQAEELARLTAENAKLKQAKAELVQIAKNQEKIDTTQAGTMENQSQLLGKLREAWRAMTDEQKAANQGMLETIQQLDAGLKRSDAEIGNFQRHVGNYAGGIAQALARLDILPPKMASYISAIGQLSKAYKGFTRIMGTGAVASAKAFITAMGGVRKALISTGIGAIIVAIGALIAHWDDLKKLIENTNPELKAKRALAEYRLEIEKLTAQGSSEKIVRLKELSHAYKEIGDNADEKKAFVAEYKDELARMGIEVNNVNQADRVLIGNTKAYVNAIVARTKADAIRAKAAKDYEAALSKMAELQKEKDGLESGIEVPWYVDVLEFIDKTAKLDPTTITDRLNQAMGFDNLHLKVSEGLAANVNAELRQLITSTDAALTKAIEEASELDKEADKTLKKGGGSKGGGGGSKGGGGESDKQKELEKIKRINAEAAMSLMDEKDKELAILKIAYEEQIKLFEKHQQDTTLIKKLYDKKKADIEAKYSSRNQDKLAQLTQLATDAERVLMDEEERELAILKEKYEGQIDLFIANQRDTTTLYEAWEKERQAIFDKYAAQRNAKTKEQTNVILEEIKEELDDYMKELREITLMEKSPIARALGITDEELKNINQQALQAAEQLFNSIAQIANNASQRRLDDALDKIEREAESEKAILEAKLENKLISQKEYEKKLAELDEQTAARKEEANKEAFKKQKAWNIAQALMNGALAVTNIWAQHGGNPIVAGILTAIAATVNAVEIAAIAAQKYARGGELHGPSHANGGIKGFVGNQHIEAEGGEVIINKRSSAKHRKLLSLINSDNGWGDDFAHARGGSGRFFARGGMIGGYDFRTAPLPEASSTLAQFARRQADNLQASFEAINRRIDNLRVSVLLSDIEAKSNEKRVHVSRAVL